MPFQGNPNAGQPDPQLLSLLFQQRANREAAAQTNQLEMMKFQAAQEAAAAKEKRLNDKHEAEMLKLRIETTNSLMDQVAMLGADQATADRAKGQVAQQYPFVSASGQQTPMGMEYGALPDQTIENGLIQNQFNDQVQRPIDLRAAMLASNMAQVPGFENYGADVLQQQGALAQATRRRLDQEAQAKSDHEFNRQAQKEKEAATTAYNRSLDKAREEAAIAAGADVRAIRAKRSEAAKWGTVANDPKISPEAREYARTIYADIQNDIEHDNLASIPGEALADRARKAKSLEEYTAIHRVNQVSKAMEARAKLGDLGHLGARAQLSWWTGNLKGLVEDASGVPFLDYYVSSVREEIDKAIRAGDSDYADRLENEMLDEKTLERIATGQLRDIDAAWVAVRANNPSGRTSNIIYNEIRNVTETISPTVSSALALSKLRTNIRSTNRALLDKRNILNEQWPGQLQFDAQSGEWIPTTKLDVADDALYSDPMTERIKNKVRKADPGRLSPDEANSALEWRRKRQGQK